MKAFGNIPTIHGYPTLYLKENKKVGITMSGEEKRAPLRINYHKNPKGGRMFKYYDIYKRDGDPVWARQTIVEFAQKQGIKKAVEHFKCSRNTIRLWLRRKQSAIDGRKEEFKNRSRKPLNPKHKVTSEQEALILKYRDQFGMCSMNLKHQYNIPLANQTIHRVLLRNSRVEPVKKKYQIKQDLRDVKERYKAFESLQIDGKVLYDIPDFYTDYKRLGVPRLQYTIRCQKTGAAFISYADGETMITALTFLVYFLEHIKKYLKVDFKEINIRLKTDWGSYAIGTKRSFKESEFTTFLKEKYNIKHVLIKHKNSNSEVERFHGLVENYFYTRVKPNSINDFYTKAHEHLMWFNLERKNGYRGWRTPLNILKQDYPNIDKNILVLPPIHLNKNTDLYLAKKDPHFVPVTPESFFKDTPKEQFDRMTSESFSHDYEYYLGDASKSKYLKQGGQDVCRFDDYVVHRVGQPEVLAPVK